MTASRRLLAAAMTVAAATALLLSWTPAGAQSTGTVTVVHGVQGLTVDVYVNGELTLEDFAPKTVTDPLQLPAGNYEINFNASNLSSGVYSYQFNVNGFSDTRKMVLLR